jgi:hypothetical protein
MKRRVQRKCIACYMMNLATRATMALLPCKLTVLAAEETAPVFPVAERNPCCPAIESSQPPLMQAGTLLFPVAAANRQLSLWHRASGCNVIQQSRGLMMQSTNCSHGHSWSRYAVKKSAVCKQVCKMCASIVVLQVQRWLSSHPHDRAAPMYPTHANGS